MVIEEIDEKAFAKENALFTDDVSKQHQHFRQLLQIKVNGNTAVKSEHNDHSSQTSSDRNIPMIFNAESPYKLVFIFIFKN